MDVFEAILTRRTVRGFTRAPVEFDKITKVIEAGTYAPSSGNLQNWRFIVVTNKEIIKDLHNYCLDQVWINEAPVVIVVCALPDEAVDKYGIRGERLYTTQNIAACVQNMLLAAHALELGSAWIGAFDEDKIKTIFNIPENVRPQALITLGYSDYEPFEKLMQPIENQVYFNTYGMIVKDLAVTLRDYHNMLKNFKKSANEEVQKTSDSARAFLKEKFNELKDNLKDLLELR
jgi:nitroreductase